MNKSSNIDVLPMVPPPHADELLHGWVLRLACACFQTPNGFLSEVLLRPTGVPNRGFWGPGPEPKNYSHGLNPPMNEMTAWWRVGAVLEQLARVSEVSVETLKGMSPLAVDPAFDSCCPARSLLAAPVCPECLLQDYRRMDIPYVRREWSYPWIAHCKTHKRLLATENEFELSTLLSLSCYYRHLVPFVRMDHSIQRYPELSIHIDDLPDQSGPFEGPLYDFDGLRDLYATKLRNALAAYPEVVWNLNTLYVTQGSIHRQTALHSERKINKFFLSASKHGQRNYANTFIKNLLLLDRVMSHEIKFGGTPRPPIPLFVRNDRFNLCEILASSLLHQGVVAHAPMKGAWRGMDIGNGRKAFDGSRYPLWRLAYGKIISPRRITFENGGEHLRLCDRALHNAILAGIMVDGCFVHRWNRSGSRHKRAMLFYLVVGMVRGKINWASKTGNAGMCSADAVHTVLDAVKVLNPKSKAAGQLLQMLERGGVVGLRETFANWAFAAAEMSCDALHVTKLRNIRAKEIRHSRDPSVENEDRRERIHWLPKIAPGRKRDADHASPYFQAAYKALTSQEGREAVARRAPGWQVTIMRLARKMLRDAGEER